MRKNTRLRVLIATSVFIVGSVSASAACFTPSYASEPMEGVGKAIDYTICLIRDQAQIINQHADAIDAVRTDLDNLRLDVIDIRNNSTPTIIDPSAFERLAFSNARKIDDLESKLDTILVRLSAMESGTPPQP